MDRGIEIKLLKLRTESKIEKKPYHILSNSYLLDSIHS